MKQKNQQAISWAAESWPRIYASTLVGTLFCIAVALAFDSFDFSTLRWRWGANPINNVIIPMLLAPPFFLLFLSKVRELAIAHKEMKLLASTDSLTSLLNRRAFNDAVLSYLRAQHRAVQGVKSALLIVDVDHFKAVNDNFGHRTGDDALKVIARTIVANIDKRHVVARIGGEEFGILIKNVPATEVSSIAEKLRVSISLMPFIVGGEEHKLSVSIGGFAFGGNCDFDGLYQAADRRLYDAKNAGRDRVALEFTS